MNKEFNIPGWRPFPMMLSFPLSPSFLFCLQVEDNMVAFVMIYCQPTVVESQWSETTGHKLLICQHFSDTNTIVWDFFDLKMLS